MVKAVVSGGEIRPLEPLPADWREGQPLQVEKADDSETPVEEIMMLAALARQHKLTVLTTDRGFEAVAGLAVENWVNPTGQA